MCKVRNKSNASVSLFLCNDMFCSRTTVNWDMIKHYSIIVRLPKYGSYIL